MLTLPGNISQPIESVKSGGGGLVEKDGQSEVDGSVDHEGRESVKPVLVKREVGPRRTRETKKRRTMMGFWRRRDLLVQDKIGGGGKKRALDDSDAADDRNLMTKKFKTTTNFEGLKMGGAAISQEVS